jgi:lactoylglutathione lyase
MIHSMIRVRDLEPSIKFYETAFGLRIKKRAAFPSFTLVYLGDDSGFELELTWNADRSTPYDHGNGYGHLAFVADDLQACHAALERAGFSPQPIKSMDHDGQAFARFFFISDPDGYKIEVLEKSGRFQ